MQRYHLILKKESNILLFLASKRCKLSGNAIKILCLSIYGETNKKLGSTRKLSLTLAVCNCNLSHTLLYFCVHQANPAER